MQLETQFPNELRSLIDWNSIPKLRVGSSLGYLFASPKYPNRSVGSRRFSELRVVRHASTMYHMPTRAADEGQGSTGAEWSHPAGENDRAGVRVSRGHG
jgi:hypothetical protein